MAQNEEITRALIESNPWWKQKFNFKYKEREIYPKLQKYLPAKQIIAITGLRRVGKTTLMWRIVQEKLASGFVSENIIYFSFDNFKDLTLSKLIETYARSFSKDLCNQKYIFLLDEVQKILHWEEQIKRIYDLHDNFKIIVSGSESLFIRKKSRESLAGRMFEFKVELLSFKEFLSFKEINYQPINLYAEELSQLFEEFISSGGFPELVDIQDNEFIKTYIRETVVEKILFKDIPFLFPIRDISALESIFKIISSNPGQIIEMNRLAGEVGISRRIVSLYLEYLENSFLIKKLFNFSANKRKTAKKLKKYYPSIPALGLLYGGEEIKSKMFENVLVIETRADFFWRDAYKNEVDIILNREEIIPLEIKSGEIKDFKGLLRFMNLFSVDQGIIISKREDRKQKFNEKEILIIPAWKWLLEK